VKLIEEVFKNGGTPTRRLATINPKINVQI